MSAKERELRANVQNSKMLEWNISEFDGEVKRANSQLDVLTQTLG